MRTNEEIVKRAKEGSEQFFGGASIDALLRFLPFENLKQFIKEDSWEETKKDWKQADLKKEEILGEMKHYMEFAWGKVENHRGLSANRSVDKMTHWVWLLGDDDLLKEIESENNFAQYGAPKLAAVCKKYDFPIPESEAIQNMINGRLCVPDCDGGCGT